MIVRASSAARVAATDRRHGRLGRGSYVLTLTTYADYVPEQETENPLPEPVAGMPDTNVVKLFG